MPTPKSFAKLAGGMGVFALARANPLLLLVTVVALARAFHKAHHTSRSGRTAFPSPSRNAVQTPSANPAPACS